MTIRDVGLSLARAMPRLRGVARRVYAALPVRLHDTPTCRAAAFFAGETAVSFVQIGAFDGLAGDPVRPLVLAREGWRGALVEPRPEAFARLRGTSATQTHRLHVVQAAACATPASR